MFQKGIIVVVTLLSAATVQAQYYYKDIVSNRMAKSEMDSFRAHQITKVQVHSFEGDGAGSEGFTCVRKIQNKYQFIETEIETMGTGKSWLTTRYSADGWLLESSDSSEQAITRNTYTYDAQQRLDKVYTIASSSDDDFHTSLTELHQYKYSEKGLPEKMILVKNGKDTTEIFFLADNLGNITDEIELKKGGRHYYYYYNATNRLTDIVKFNVVKNKLLPDFIFTYDEDGRVVQLVAVDDGISGNYVTWYYTYNDGLKIIEKCYSKENKLLGYVEYEYN
ncbi:MAG: hypothetical protein RLY16_1304 [Bacteroidota bacterium]|jgi:hypothetical protein